MLRTVYVRPRLWEARLGLRDTPVLGEGSTDASRRRYPIAPGDGIELIPLDDFTEEPMEVWSLLRVDSNHVSQSSSYPRPRGVRTCALHCHDLTGTICAAKSR